MLKMKRGYSLLAAVISQQFTRNSHSTVGRRQREFGARGFRHTGCCLARSHTRFTPRQNKSSILSLTVNIDFNNLLYCRRNTKSPWDTFRNQNEHRDTCTHLAAKRHTDPVNTGWNWHKYEPDWRLVFHPPRTATMGRM